MAERSDLDGDVLREVVRQAIDEVLGERASGRGTGRAEEPSRASTPPTSAANGSGRADSGPRRELPGPISARAIDELKRLTPARIITGRTGTRYLTDSYLGLRADHAIALDAVNSEVPEGFAEGLGWLSLRSRCESHQQFLLHPDEGRRLDQASEQRLAAEGDKGADVQVIAGDGLSAWALIQNGPPLVASLQARLPQAGFRVGRPLFVKFARVGIQDHVGVVLGCKATIILVGERPGLGTGDSLSIYTAFGPKLGQDNSEKDCISNIRNLGVLPERAADACVDLMKRTFAAGGGGVRLVEGA